PAPAAAPQGTSLSGYVSPLAARMAKDLRIDVSRVPGTGHGGRVTKDDVMRFVRSGGNGHAMAGTQPAAAAQPRGAMASFISPVVARLSGEHGIDLQAVLGTGKDGRITK